VGEQWHDQAARALAERRYTYVLWDPAQQGYEMLSIIKGAGYVDIGSLFEPNDGFFLWKTHLTPDVEVYVAPERAANSGIPVASVHSR
jgi:hypothetical protein